MTGRFSDSYQEGFDAHNINTAHLGDGDPEIEKLVLHSTSTPDSSLHNIQLNIPGFDKEDTQKEDQVQTVEKELSDSERSLVGSESQYKHVNSLRTTPSPPPIENQTKLVGKSFVTSTHYLKDQLPGPRGAFNQNSYFVKSSCNPNQNISNRCGTSAFSGTKKPLTPFEKKYSHLVSARNTIPQPRAYSANSIRKLDKPSSRTKTMSNFNYGGDMYTLTSTSLSRAQEKEELQRLNDRFTSYISKVRQLGQQSGQLDSSSFLKSARILEEEVSHLKNLYERELESLRLQLEDISREKIILQQHCGKHQQSAQDLEDRLLVETDRNRKLVDQINNCQQKINNLEQELMHVRAAPRPIDDIPRMQRDLDNLTRENENFKRRWEKEQLLRQEVEEKLHACFKKSEFDHQVQNEQQSELRQRLESATSTIFGLENRVRELSKTDSNIPDLIKQVREAAEEELQKYQAESEQQYTRNISALKVQMENDASTIERLDKEKSQVLGSIGDLKARITNLEGEIRMIDHQRQSLEETLNSERARSADQLQSMERRFREVQEVLFVKMQEANISRDTNVPLKAEIEALKALLQEEERRLTAPVDVSSATLKQTATSSSVTQNYASSPPPLQTSQVFTTYQPPMSTSYQMQSSMYPPPPAQSTAYPQQTSSYQTETVTYPPQTSGYQVETVHATEPLYSSVQNEYDASADFPISGTRYNYETTPSVNKLQIEPSPPVTPRPVGPVVRVKSAPSSGRSGQSLGQGKDYFDEMFRDLTSQTINTYSRPKSSPTDRYPMTASHDYTTATSRYPRSSKSIRIKKDWKFCAVGDVKILDVNQEGKFVRLVNEGGKEVEFGGYMLQQNVGGHPVAVYRFPPRTKFTGNNTITVWSGNNDPMLHQPPTDYVWKEQEKWGTGPECTTILCKPNGQAIAWTTAAHRFTKNAFEDSKAPSEVDQILDINDELDQVNQIDDEGLTEMTVNINEQRPEAVYLRRQKQQPPTLSPQKHPHGSNPIKEVHPHTSQPRPFTYGNDNSSVNRQSRSQTTRPDPIPGAPYAGASAQRMGSASLRKYSPTHNIRGNGTITNKSQEDEQNERTSTPPNPFMTPHNKFDNGLKQLASQHNVDFLPPMPRPPLFSTW
ncbi:uncharacterized protein LOC127706276 isoform X3 [Mytilus californianus]|uniref:uncharacterized protein LOC127706276 isoform X3 n=1 Tax=Mytilus californianus TaxID=6549 RepID=UPI002245254F|nr:uncharacterized protein LOC127706276 isoform X3 [Mytilus californianus]